MSKTKKTTKANDKVEAQSTTPAAKAATESAKAKPALEQNQELVRLTQEIKDDLGRIDGLVKTSVTTARGIGQRLIQVKKIVKNASRSWNDWVRDHLPVSLRQIQKYMKLATRWDDLVKKGHDPEQFSIDQSVALLARPDGKIPEVPWDSKANSGHGDKTADQFRVASADLLKDKKLQAHELMDSEALSFAPDSPEVKFLTEKVRSIVRHVRQEALRLKKNAKGSEAIDPMVVAIALIHKLRAELMQADVVEVVAAGPAEEVNGASEVGTTTPHNRLNGHVPAMPA